MEIISSQSFLHENFLMARCLPYIILNREIGRKGHSGDSRFLHQQVPGILQEKLAERGVMLYNETCAEGFYIFR